MHQRERNRFITQYGSTVHRDCYGLSPLKTIYKDFVQFEVDFTFNIKVKNV